MVGFCRLRWFKSKLISSSFSPQCIVAALFLAYWKRIMKDSKWISANSSRNWLADELSTHELSSQHLTPFLFFAPRLPPLCSAFFFVHLPCSSIFTFLLPSHYSPGESPLLTPLSSLIDFPLNINRKKNRSEKSSTHLPVWLAEILDLSILFRFSEQRSLSDDLSSWMLRDPLNVVEGDREREVMKRVVVWFHQLQIYCRQSYMRCSNEGPRPSFPSEYRINALQYHNQSESPHHIVHFSVMLIKN